MKIAGNKILISVVAGVFAVVLFFIAFYLLEIKMVDKPTVYEIQPVVSVRISQGDLWATKTYVNDYVENPDGTKLLYRYFPISSQQPKSRTDYGLATQMWMCDPNGENPIKLFDIANVGLWSELGHGSESMIWIDDAHFYYNGVLFDTSTSSIQWRIGNSVMDDIPYSAWSDPVNGKLFLNIRTGTNAGYYWIDPTATTAPVLNPVIGRDEMKPFLGGDPLTYQFTYIKLSPLGSYLYFVMYVNGVEYGFTSKADGTDITKLGNNADTSMPYNGHAIWYDNDRMIYADYRGNVTKTCDRFGGDPVVVAGPSNHITLSPDKRWIASDAGNYTVRLYLLGHMAPVENLMVMEVRGGTTDPHPSFSRDGKRVYYMGKSGTNSEAVYYTEVSQWTKNANFIPDPYKP